MKFNAKKVTFLSVILISMPVLLILFQNYTIADNFPARQYPEPVIYLNKSFFPYSSGAPSSVKTYYIDCSKSVNGDGLSESTAFNKLSSVNSLATLNSNTSILFKRGSNCYGSLKIKPIAAITLILDDYGNPQAPAPVISGLQGLNTLTAVSLASGKVNEINLPAGTIIKDLFYNKVAASIAAFNDKCSGLAKVHTIIDSASQFVIAPNSLKFTGPNTFPSGVLFQPTKLSGEPFVFVRNARWTWSKKNLNLANTSDNVLTFTKNFAYAPDDKSGIEFANAPELIDCPGEWAIDQTRSKLWILPSTATASINEYTVSTLKTGLEIDLSQVAKHSVNLIVQDLTFDGFYGDAIRVNFLKDVHFQKISVLRSGNTGINIYNSLSFYLGDSRVAATAGMSLSASLNDSAYDSSHVWIEKNSFENNGRFALSLNGTGPNEEVRLDSLFLASRHTMVINHNSLNMIGGNALSIGSQNAKSTATSTQVIANKIDNYCQLINDCGAVYINGYLQRGFTRDAFGKENGMRTTPYPLNFLIYHNKIYNGHGETNYTPYKKHAQAAGIYLDWAASNASIAYNQIIQARHFLGSVAFHGGSNIILQQNQIYQNRLPAIGFRQLWNPGMLCVPMSGNIISKNDVAIGTTFSHTARRINNYTNCSVAYSDMYALGNEENINNFFSINSLNQLTTSTPRELDYTLQDQWTNPYLPGY